MPALPGDPALDVRHCKLPRSMEAVGSGGPAGRAWASLASLFLVQHRIVSTQLLG